MRVFFYKILLSLVLGMMALSAKAQIVEDEKIEYDFFDFLWTGLTEDEFQYQYSPHDFSRIIYEAFPKDRRAKADFDRAFLPHYLEKKIQSSNPVHHYQILNFVVGDMDSVITLHTFFMDSLRRIHRYWNMATLGKSNDFKILAEKMRDSIKIFVDTPQFNPPKSVQDAWRMTLHACMLPREKSFLANLAKINPTDKSFDSDEFDAETALKAVKHYLMYSNSKYFDAFVSSFKKDSQRKKFRNKYTRLWMLVNALKVFHSIKGYYKAAEKYKDKRDEYRGKAADAIQLFKGYAIDSLNKVPLEKNMRSKEFKLWNKYAKDCNLDSLSNMLVRSALLIQACADMMSTADSLQRNREWHQAMSLYMDVLRNNDVTEILGNMTGGANCSDLKGTALKQLDELRDTMKQMYLDAFAKADSTLRRARIKEDSLKVVDMYHDIARLNQGLSATAWIKIQKLYMELGDARPRCHEIAEAEKYYQMGIMTAQTVINPKLLARLKDLAQRKVHCNSTPKSPSPKSPSQNPTPVAPAMDIFFPIDSTSPESDKKVFLNDIANILYQNVTGNTDDISNLNKKIDFVFQNGKLIFSLEVLPDKVVGTLHEMNFPLGEYLGDPYAEQKTMLKLSTAIQSVFAKYADILSHAYIKHEGSADKTQFKNKCIPEKQNYNKKLSKEVVTHCITGETQKFSDLYCGTNAQKNLGLAYLRAYRRKDLMEQYLGKHKFPIKEQLCGAPKDQTGPQYRYVNTVIEFQLKPTFQYKITYK